MFTLRYAKENDLADFYIQCKGLHSGRPLQNYIPNSFAVFGADAYDFERCFCVWKSKAYDYYIRGSVVPFVSIVEVRELLDRCFSKMEFVELKKIIAIKQLNELIINSEKKIVLLKNMQCAFAYEVLK